MLESDQALNLWTLNGDEMFNHLFIFRIWDHICNIFCLCWYCRFLPMNYRASSTWMEWIMRVYVVDKSSGLTKWCRSFTEFEYWIYSKILIKACRKLICRLSSASLVATVQRSSVPGGPSPHERTSQLERSRPDLRAERAEASIGGSFSFAFLVFGWCFVRLGPKNSRWGCHPK